MSSEFFSQKNMTIFLLVVIVVLLYQTAALAMLNGKLQTANVGFGATPAAINLTDTGGAAPQMVGGC